VVKFEIVLRQHGENADDQQAGCRCGNSDGNVTDCLTFGDACQWFSQQQQKEGNSCQENEKEQCPGKFALKKQTKVNSILELCCNQQDVERRKRDKKQCDEFSDEF